MKTEVQQLERLKVGRCLVEREGRQLVKEKQVMVLTSRWVLTQKTADIARCRIVVRDFATLHPPDSKLLWKLPHLITK